MADTTLMELIKEVRWKTLKLLEDIDDAQARWTPAGLNNSILWHAGHSLIVVEHLGCMTIAGGEPAYPKDWFDKFSWKSEPAKVTQWPTVAEVVEKLKDQRTRLFALVEPLEKNQEGELFNRIQRIGQPAGPELVPKCIDLRTKNGVSEHGARSG